MWNKEEKTYVKEHYKFVKAGEKGTSSAVLLAMLKDAELKDACPVIECKEEDGDYIFVAPCPFCGELHIHGNKPGFRSPHCGNDRYKLLIKVYPKLGYGYFIANKQEYSDMWKRAEKADV